MCRTPPSVDLGSGDGNGLPGSGTSRLTDRLSHQLSKAGAESESGDERGGEKAKFRDVRHLMPAPPKREWARLAGSEANLMSF